MELSYSRREPGRTDPQQGEFDMRRRPKSLFLLFALIALWIPIAGLNAGEPNPPTITNVQHWFTGGNLNLLIYAENTAGIDYTFAVPLNISAFGNPWTAGGDVSCLTTANTLTLTPIGGGVAGAPWVQSIPPTPDSQPEIEAIVGPEPFDPSAIMVFYDYHAGGEAEMWGFALPSGGTWDKGGAGSHFPDGHLQAHIPATDDDVRFIIKARACGIYQTKDMGTFERADDDCE
jgi:hypothetical protein